MSDNQFREWDKWVSRFIWQGKKPQTRFNTLQIGRERGGMALPCFSYHYYASQLIPIMYWLDGEYKARWKEIEVRLTPNLPFQAIIADRGLATNLEEVKKTLDKLHHENMAEGGQVMRTPQCVKPLEFMNEAGMRLREEAWGKICKFQSSSTNSSDWREFCWKNTVRYFKTPQQGKYKDAD